MDKVDVCRSDLVIGDSPLESPDRRIFVPNVRKSIHSPSWSRRIDEDVESIYFNGIDAVQ